MDVDLLKGKFLFLKNSKPDNYPVTQEEYKGKGL